MNTKLLAEKVVLIVLSAFASYFLCIYYLDGILENFGTPSAVLLSIKILWTVLIFVFLNWIKNKKNLTFVIKIALSVFASYRICYYILDDILLRFNDSQMAFLSLRIVLTVSVYIILNWLTDKNVYIVTKDIFFASYLFFILVLSLFGDRYSAIFQGVNFNIFNLFKGSKLIVFLNAVVYIPPGYYLRNRLKFKMVYIYMYFLLYICALEFFQFILKQGYFDLNDIILNTFGFSLGIVFQYIYNAIRKKLRQHFQGNNIHSIE